ncbi:MAG: DUF6138 family protein [Prevotellaceae bacterium]|jgi:hypothetical protein|nr:DUF6138 family protein [Prevotellaceae bacterium]
MTSKRNYLIFEDVQKDTSLRPVFDACVNMILDSSARITKTEAEKGYPQHVCFHTEGLEILAGDVFIYYLFKLGVSGFDYEKARDFSERMLKLAGFSFEVCYPLEQWVNRCLRDPYFYNKNGKDSFYKEWVLKQGEAHDFIKDDYFKFACYIAICYIRHGESYTAKKIFSYVAALGSNLPDLLKKNGSGDLPKEIVDYVDNSVSCKANDAFAVIRIAVKIENEETYGKILDFLCCLLETDFPRSYSINFRSQDKNFLPIKGLPKKGVHRLFANAMRYPKIHGKIERYARLSMKEFEWYENLKPEDCAMPGTFAVFALGMHSAEHATLAVDYLNLCDNEHSSIQGKFIAAYIAKFGFSESSIRVFFAGAASMQELPPNRIYREAIANENALFLLLNAKRETNKYAWHAALYAIWGEDFVYDNTKIQKAAPPKLQVLYEQIFNN